MDKNVVITGANRGIGLALAHHYSTNGSQVFAVCRNSSTTLDEMNNVTIVDGIDVTNLRNLQHLKSVMEGIKIDILINNAGILTEELLCEIDYERIEQQFKVNAMGPLRTTEALLNQLHTGAKVVLITSRMGSLADNSSGASYGYRMSKAALNAAGVSLAHDLKPKGIAVCMLHPGFVQTDLVGYQGNINTQQSAKQIQARIKELTLNNSGWFKHANGEQIPW